MQRSVFANGPDIRHPPSAIRHLAGGMLIATCRRMKPTRSTTWFTRFSKTASRATGRPVVFGLAILFVAVWGISGFLFDFSNTWQLVINTFTTVVTFLMVFLIQSTQNRDSEAMQVKLDELIRTTRGANNELLDLEEMEEEELDRVRMTYEQLAERARRSARITGRPDCSVVDLPQSKTERART
jgi:low affinity Fe/Cu permease